MIKIRKKILSFIFVSLFFASINDVKPLSTDMAATISVGIPSAIMLGTISFLIKYNIPAYDAEPIISSVFFVNFILCLILINKLTKLTPAHKFKEKCSKIIEKINQFNPLINGFNFDSFNDEELIKNIKTMYEEYQRFPLISAYKDLKSILLEFRQLKKLIVNANIDLGVAVLNQKEFTTGSPQEKFNFKIIRVNPIDTTMNTLSFINLFRIGKIFLALKQHTLFLEELDKFKFNKNKNKA